MLKLGENPATGYTFSFQGWSRKKAKEQKVFSLSWAGGGHIYFSTAVIEETTKASHKGPPHASVPHSASLPLLQALHCPLCMRRSASA